VAHPRPESKCDDHRNDGDFRSAHRHGMVGPNPRSELAYRRGDRPGLRVPRAVRGAQGTDGRPLRCAGGFGARGMRVGVRAKAPAQGAETNLPPRRPWPELARPGRRSCR
jgi:hypothetical protein